MTPGDIVFVIDIVKFGIIAEQFILLTSGLHPPIHTP
jgi:hypothetical protein